VVEEFELVEKELVVYAGQVAEFCRRRRRLFVLACFFVSGERREGEDETFSVSRRGERRTSIEKEEEEEESKESSSDSVNVRNHAILSYNVSRIHHHHHRREHKDALASTPAISETETSRRAYFRAPHLSLKE
jgi:hypothetical protein